MGKKSLFHWEKIKIGAHGLSTKNSTIKGFLVGKKVAFSGHVISLFFRGVASFHSFSILTHLGLL